jgi:hypothetical protein
MKQSSLKPINQVLDSGLIVAKSASGRECCNFTEEVDLLQKTRRTKHEITFAARELQITGRFNTFC